MDSYVIRQFDRIGEDKVELERYKVMGVDPLVVEGLDGNVPVDSAMDHEAIIGTWCWGIRQHGRVVLIGFDRTDPPSAICTVSGTGNPATVVQPNGSSFTVPYLTSYTPTAGDQVAVQWTPSGAGWQGVILGKISTSSGPPPAYEWAPSISTQEGVMAVPPQFSWPSYDGWWDDDEDDPGQGRYGSGQLLSGWWLYGDGAFGVAGGKRLTNSRITLNRIPKWNPSSAGLTATLALHTQATRGPRAPQGAEILATVDLPDVTLGKKDYTIPNEWVARLANPEDPAKGVGVVPGPNPNLNYILFASMRDDPECGRISCDWSTALDRPSDYTPGGTA